MNKKNRRCRHGLCRSVYSCFISAAQSGTCCGYYSGEGGVDQSA